MQVGKGRRPLKDSELGNLQACGASFKDLNTVERALNTKKRVEIEERRNGVRPATFIFIEGEQFLELKGY